VLQLWRAAGDRKLATPIDLRVSEIAVAGRCLACAARLRGSVSALSARSRLAGDYVAQGKFQVRRLPPPWLARIGVSAQRLRPLTRPGRQSGFEYIWATGLSGQDGGSCVP